MIKKTDFTREEDEKLLHLAKLMPTQWRTIAPMVGRTAGQCLERYSQLLDGAAGAYDADEQGAGIDVRLGEVDPNPEGKPARPDPVDMDEDEKEMLSEAKARLANTRGKKAKRQAREKLLEGAKRIAKLQKYREMKAAGIGGKIPKSFMEGRNKKDKAGIDYFSGEIPFERQVPVGFYDTANETFEGSSMSSSRESKAKLMKLANADPDARAKADRESMKRDRERFEKLAKHNLEAALQEVDKRNSNTTSMKKSKMLLPAPQVTDAELEDIARSHHHKSRPSTATDDLIDTPIVSTSSQITRTPMAPDVVLEEARNHRLRVAAPTPLAGGARIEMTASGTGFQGSTPSIRSVTTPSVINQSNVSVSTQATSYSLRDSLAINHNEEMPSEAIVSKEEQRQRRDELVQKLKTGLSALPAPKYSYQVQAPSKLGEEDNDVITEDAADADAKHAKHKQQEIELQLSNRTMVTKRGLPIPTRVPKIDNEEDSIESLVNTEVVVLLRQDVLDEDPPMRVAKEYLQAAETMIANQLKHYSVDEVTKHMQQVEGQFVLIPQENGQYEIVNNPTKAQRLLRCQKQFRHAQVKIIRIQKQVGKNEKKTHKFVLGLRNRSQKAVDEFISLQKQIENAARDLATFKHMQQMEQEAVIMNIHDLEERLESVAAIESKLQNSYYSMTFI